MPEPDPVSVTPLGALILECRHAFRDRHGVELSYADIARRSGGRITRGRVQQLARERIRELPTPEKIQALAVGLGVPVSVVLERALESAGYRPHVQDYASLAELEATARRDLEQADRDAVVRLRGLGSSEPGHPANGQATP